MQDKIYKQATGFVAILLIAILAAPAAFAVGAEAPRASGSAAKVSAKLAKLKTQLAVLRQQVSTLEAQSAAPRTPTGAAGGDLTGSYPNPQVGLNAIGALEIQANAVGAAEIQANAVGSDELQDNSVGIAEVQAGAVGSAEIVNNSVLTEDIADGTVDFSDIRNNAIGTSKIADGAVGAADLGSASVGSSELQALTATVSAGKSISAGAPQNVSVTCPEGRTLLAGGYGWQQDEGNSIIASAPSEADPTHTWVVRGMVDAGSNTLFAWATCLGG